MNQRSRMPVYLLVATLAATIYAGDVDVGPFSLRVYLYLALLGWMVTRSLLRQESLVDDIRATTLLLSYVVFVGWYAITLSLQGSPIALIAVKTINYHGLSILTAVLTLYIVRTRADVFVFARGLVVILLMSCTVAILQWRQVSAAWDLWHLLRPQVAALPGEMGLALGDEGTRTLGNPGLFATAAVFGYYVSAIVPIVFRRFMARTSVLTISSLALAITGLFVVQQRASLLGVALACGLLFYVQLRNRVKVAKLIVVVALLVVFISAVFFTQLRQQSEGMPVTNRYLDLQDIGRLQVAAVALRFISAHPFIGGVDGYLRFYEEQRWAGTRYKAVTPHNMFLNAGVYTGVPGLLWIIFFTIQLGVIMAQCWRQARLQNDWTTITLVAALVGYLVSAQFHNASFVSGDIFPWVLIGLMLRSSKVTQKFRPEANQAASRGLSTLPAA